MSCRSLCAGGVRRGREERKETTKKTPRLDKVADVLGGLADHFLGAYMAGDGPERGGRPNRDTVSRARAAVGWTCDTGKSRDVPRRTSIGVCPTQSTRQRHRIDLRLVHPPPCLRITTSPAIVSSNSLTEHRSVLLPDVPRADRSARPRVSSGERACVGWAGVGIEFDARRARTFP